MKTLMIMQGAPGSGKTTKAKEIAAAFDGEAVIFSTDDYWYANPEVYAFDADRLDQAHRWNQSRVESSMKYGVGLIVVDNTNVLRSYVQPYEDLAERHGYAVEYCRVDPGLDECLRRNALRHDDRIIPEDVVRSLHEKMETLGKEGAVMREEVSDELMSDEEFRMLHDEGSYFAMFTVVGNRAVANSLRPKIARLNELKAEGFEPTEAKLAQIVQDVTEEVALQGHGEVHDTAVREEIWSAVEETPARA